MSTPENKTPATDAVKALQLFLKGVDEEAALSPEQVLKELQAFGIDIKQMATEVRKRISQAQNRLRLTEIRSQAVTGGHLAKPIAGAGMALDELKKAVAAVIERVTAAQPQAAGVFYRKLEGSTEDDLASLLADLNELEAQQKRDESEDRR